VHPIRRQHFIDVAISAATGSQLEPQVPVFSGDSVRRVEPPHCITSPFPHYNCQDRQVIPSKKITEGRLFDEPARTGVRREDATTLINHPSRAMDHITPRRRMQQLDLQFATIPDVIGIKECYPLTMRTRNPAIPRTRKSLVVLTNGQNLIAIGPKDVTRSICRTIINANNLDWAMRLRESTVDCGAEKAFPVEDRNDDAYKLSHIRVS
jgi:hypothetical protein